MTIFYQPYAPFNCPHNDLALLSSAVTNCQRGQTDVSAAIKRVNRQLGRFKRGVYRESLSVLYNLGSSILQSSVLAKIQMEANVKAVANYAKRIGPKEATF